MKLVSQKVLLVFFLLLLSGYKIQAQSELMDLLNETEDDDKNYVSATFKSTRLLNGHSIETRTGGVLEFVISHRFGAINTGVSQLYGLDQSFVRFALEYGITDRLNAGFGRSSFGKVVDGFLKYKLLKQSDDMPITLTAFSSMAIDTQELPEDSPADEFRYRIDYSYQLLLARKFNSDFSMQLMPSLVHRNLAPGSEENMIFVMGVGARYKLTNRLALDFEYYNQMREMPENIRNAVAVGLEIETGGHVFQLIFSNATQMIEKGFLTETTDDFFDGDIHFGFNISRVFDLKPGHKKN
ncbi:MAG: DUF5777 family beta-barrel protein [Cyclobacteriaceae bacterium]